jgi:hypothetical protein
MRHAKAHHREPRHALKQAHDLFGKPLHTFPDHALAEAQPRALAHLFRLDFAIARGRMGVQQG